MTNATIGILNQIKFLQLTTKGENFQQESSNSHGLKDGVDWTLVSTCTQH